VLVIDHEGVWITIRNLVQNKIDLCRKHAAEGPSMGKGPMLLRRG